jgi:hypothetical protein
MATRNVSPQLSKVSDGQATIQEFEVSNFTHSQTTRDLRVADDALLAELGYRSEFRREFSVIFISDFLPMRA